MNEQDISKAVEAVLGQMNGQHAHHGEGHVWRCNKNKMTLKLANALIEKGFKVTKQHGQWFEKNGVFMMGTFHPAALLRNPHNKPDAFEDMLALQKKIREICDHTYDGTEL